MFYFVSFIEYYYTIKSLNDKNYGKINGLRY